jgi:type IV pilus assembly protein PilA
MTLIELMIGVTIIAVLLGLAVTTLRRAKVAGNEASAISSLRVIRSAQIAYAATCGGSHFATGFMILGAKRPNAPYPYLNEDLGSAAAPVHASYRFEMRTGLGGSLERADCTGNPTQNQFYVSAEPVGDSGTRAFSTNEKGVIYEMQGSTAPPEPYGPPAKPIQ